MYYANLKRRRPDNIFDTDKNIPVIAIANYPHGEGIYQIALKANWGGATHPIRMDGKDNWISPDCPKINRYGDCSGIYWVHPQDVDLFTLAKNNEEALFLLNEGDFV